MPFVEILWRSERLDRAALKRLIDAVPDIVARRFSAVDAEHRVDPDMVDVRVTQAGDLDRINPDLYVTVLARKEDVREAQSDRLIRAITDDLRQAGLPSGAMVELILTTRASSYDYGGR